MVGGNNNVSLFFLFEVFAHSFFFTAGRLHLSSDGTGMSLYRYGMPTSSKRTINVNVSGSST